VHEGYECKECGAPAHVDEDSKLVRTCAHTGTVIATMKATAYGVGGASVVQPSRAHVLIDRVLAQLRGMLP
jgi:alanine racemase